MLGDVFMAPSLNYSLDKQSVIDDAADWKILHS